ASIEGDTSVRALAYKQIGADILGRVRDALGSGGDLSDIVVLKNGKVYMEPGAAPLTIEQVASGHEAYVLHTTNNVVRYDDGVPDNAADIFAGMRTD
ncbi:MAG: hypothetical protein GY832_11120, partial [Chloroflexi bacterium]|nr:hypothetical protein [Chloroflexota bacterium]